jgi:hypothetical protein
MVIASAFTTVIYIQLEFSCIFADVLLPPIRGGRENYDIPCEKR